jgi:hypothetical protein
MAGKKAKLPGLDRKEGVEAILFLRRSKRNHREAFEPPGDSLNVCFDLTSTSVV